MTQHRSISLLTRGKGISAPIPRPAAKPGVITTEIDQLLLENPKAEDIKSYRSSGWRVAFESFSVVPTANAGIKTHHFMRLEKMTASAQQ